MRKLTRIFILIKKKVIRKKTISEAIRHELTTTHQNLITLFISSFGLFMENNQELFGHR
jgi:hypothetical protein